MHTFGVQHGSELHLLCVFTLTSIGAGRQTAACFSQFCLARWLSFFFRCVMQPCGVLRLYHIYHSGQLPHSAEALRPSWAKSPQSEGGPPCSQYQPPPQFQRPLGPNHRPNLVWHQWTTCQQTAALFTLTVSCQHQENKKIKTKLPHNSGSR